MYKRAVLLAGGQGVRLKPFTVSLPKPLVPIGQMPIIEIIIRQLVKNGFDHITITVNHLADIIKAFCGNGEKWDVKIDYSLEDMPLSTMGPLKLIDDLPENFLVMNGDILTNLNLSEFYDYHVENYNNFTISSSVRQHRIDYGVLLLDKNNKLTHFEEKPSVTYCVSMGVYMVNKQILKYIPKDTAYGFDNLMLELIKIKKPATVKIFDGYWLDIGRPDDYEKACNDFENNLIQI